PAHYPEFTAVSRLTKLISIKLTYDPASQLENCERPLDWCSVCNDASFLFKLAELKGCLKLHDFYVQPRVEQVPLTASEEKALAGLGKIALCETLRLVADRLQLDPNVVVVLEASGAAAIPPSIERLRDLNSLSVQHLRFLLRRKLGTCLFVEVLREIGTEVAKFRAETEEKQTAPTRRTTR